MGRAPPTPASDQEPSDGFWNDGTSIEGQQEVLWQKADPSNRLKSSLTDPAWNPK